MANDDGVAKSVDAVVEWTQGQAHARAIDAFVEWRQADGINKGTFVVVEWRGADASAIEVMAQVEWKLRPSCTGDLETSPTLLKGEVISLGKVVGEMTG